VRRTLLIIFFVLFFQVILVGQSLFDKKGMVGIQLSEVNNRIIVVGVFKNSPAERAGFTSGDEISSVNGNLVAGLTLQEVIGLFNGDPGTKVDVKIKRNNQEMALNVVRVSPDNLVDDSPDFRNMLDNTPKSREQMLETTEAIEVKWTKFLEENYGFKSVLINESFAQKLGSLFTEGLLITMIDKSFPSATAIKKWDLITKINDIDVRIFFQTSNLISSSSAVSLPTIKVNILSVTGEATAEIKPKIKK